MVKKFDVDIVINGDITNLNTALKEADQGIAALVEEMREVERLLQLDPKNIELLGQKYFNASKNVDQLIQRLNILKVADQSAQEALGKTPISLSQYDEIRQEVELTKQALETYTKEQVKANKVLSEVETPATIMIESLKGAKTEFISFSSLLKTEVLENFISEGLEKGISVLKDFAKTSIESAISFEASFSNVENTVHATAEELETLKANFIELSTVIPVTAESINQMASLAGQLGIEFGFIPGFTETILGLSEVTNISAAEGATNLAKFATVTKMSQENFDRLGSSLVALGNNFSTQEATILNMSQQFADTATTANASESSILAVSAAVSSLGISEQVGGTGMQKIFSDLQQAVETSADELEKFASISGVSVEVFTEAFQRDATSALLLFVEGLGDTTEAGKSTVAMLDEMGYKEADVSQVLQGLAGNAGKLRDALEISSGAWEENMALQDEVSTKYSTTESQMAIMENRLTAIGIAVGEKALPGIVGLSDAFVTMVEDNADNIGNFGDSVATFLSVIVEHAPAGIALLKGIAVAFATWKIGGMATDFMELIGKVKTSVTTFQSLGSAVAGTMGTLNAASGIIGLLAVAINLGINKWNEYKAAQEEARLSIINAHETLEELEKGVASAGGKEARLDGLIQSYKDISEQIKTRQLHAEDLTEAEKELSDVEEELVLMSDGYISKQEIENGLTDEKIDKVYELMELEKELAEIELANKIAELQDENIEEKLEKTIKSKEILIEREAEIQAGIARSKELYVEYNKMMRDDTITVEEKGRRYAEMREAFLEIEKSMGHINGYNWENVNTFFSGNLNSSLKESSKLVQNTKEEIISLTKEQGGLQHSLDIISKYTEESNELLGDQADYFETVKDSILVVENAYDSHMGAIDNVITVYKELAGVTDELVDAFANQENNLENLEVAYEKISQGGQLTHKELAELASIYPEMTRYIEEHGFALETDADIFSSMSTEIRNGRQRNIEAAIIEAEATISQMEAQAEAAKVNYTAIINILMAVEEARSMESGVTPPVSGISPAERQTLKDQQTQIENEIKNAKENKKKLEEALVNIEKIETRAYKRDKSSDKKPGASSSRVAEKEAEANELFKIAYEAYETDKRYNKLSLENSLQVLEEIKVSTMAAGKDLEKIEYEQFQIREKLQQAEVQSMNEFGDAVTEARKRQITDVFTAEKKLVEETASLIKEVTYEEINLESELGEIKLKRIDDEYWAKSEAALQERAASENLQEIITDNHFSKMSNIEQENLASLRGLDAEIDKHLEIIGLTNEALSKDLKVNREKLDALNEAEKQEREFFESKHHEERKLALDERLLQAETDEDREKALEELASFEAELQQKAIEKKRQADRDRLQEERKELVHAAKTIIDQELEDIETLVSAQEAGIKRISESVGVEALDALEEKMDAYLKGAAGFAIELVNAGENGVKEALGILEKYYPDWNEKGKKFVDFLTAGMKEKLADLIATARHLGDEAGNAFESAFQDARESNEAGSSWEETMSMAMANGNLTTINHAPLPAFSQMRNASDTEIHYEVNIENNFDVALPADLPSTMERANRRSALKMIGGIQDVNHR